MGEECDQCKPGFFALHEDNPEGCIECFCSGLSTECEATEFSSFNSTVSFWLFGFIMEPLYLWA